MGIRLLGEVVVVLPRTQVSVGYGKAPPRVQLRTHLQAIENNSGIYSRGKS